MSITRTGIPKEFSFSSNDSFRLNDSTSTVESIQNGEDFANTISHISKGEFTPERAKYPRFRKIFYEESQYNPSIANTHQVGYEHNAHQIEQRSHWSKTGHVVSLEERFPDPKPQNETGPVKPSEHPHFFEKSVKYFGRNRQLNPFHTAHQYTKPLDRVDKEVLKRIAEDKAKAGPGTYKPPDYWEKIVYGSVAEPLRPMAMMEIKEKRDIFMFYNIPDYVELKKETKSRPADPPYQAQRGKMSTLLRTTSPPRSASSDSEINVNVSSSPRRKLLHAISKSRLRGAKFPDSKLDYNYRGVPHDTQFVRLKKKDGTVLIAPTLIGVEKPQDELVLKGTEKIPVWGDVSEKRDIYCTPVNSKIDMYGEDGTSEAAQQDVYTLRGEVVELHVGKLTLPKSSRQGSNPITINARKPPLNSTHPRSTPVTCTPHLTNRSLLYNDLRKRKKYSSVNTPEVLSRNQIPLSTSDKFLLARKEGFEDSDFNHMLHQSNEIVELFNT